MRKPAQTTSSSKQFSVQFVTFRGLENAREANFEGDFGDRLGLGRFGWGGNRDPAASANAGTLADHSPHPFVELSIEMICLPNPRK
jgi:hypothetical protein